MESDPQSRGLSCRHGDSKKDRKASKKKKKLDKDKCYRSLNIKTIKDLLLIKKKKLLMLYIDLLCYVKVWLLSALINQQTQMLSAYFYLTPHIYFPGNIKTYISLYAPLTKRCVAFLEDVYR